MQLFKREKYLKKIRPFYHETDLIKVITGVRRCGKSSLMQTVAEEIISGGVPENNIVYIDLDTRRYRSIKEADQLDKLIDEFTKTIDEGTIYIFIDEIQNVNGFEEVINGFRTDGGCSIFITGSNSYLLSGELVTKLTGRYLEFELFTLSFDEYEAMKNFFGKDVDGNPLNEINNYILEGGFPRTLLFDTLEEKRTYTENVIREIFEKDIRKRVKIKNKAAFEAVRAYIINNFGATTSIKGLHEALRKNGLEITRVTVARYIQTLVDAKILYECTRFDMKSKRSLNGEKKYYVSDLSFYFALNTDNRINYGPILENIIYFYARGQGYAVSVGRIGRLECDFILRDANMNYSYVQVAYTIQASKDTEEREYRALEAIRDNYDKYLMTLDYLVQKRNGIKHVNLVEFIKNKQVF